MHGLELFLLGRALTKIGEQALPGALYHRLPPGVRAIAVDVAEHPDSSVTEIVQRTGYRQSQVSAGLDRLRELGVVVTAPDPVDRRRTLARPHPDTEQRVAEHLAEPIDAALGAAIGTDDPRVIAEVRDALETLSRHIGRAQG
ncbi:MarR family transcriptional regulator [Actinomycetes bacterium KLBMP 9759]